jgi:TonB family protein
VSSGFGGGVAGGKGSRGMMGAGGGGGLQSVKSGIQAEAAAGKTVGKDGKLRRSDEDIRKVFDQNSGRLFGVYQRALRDDPSLQGTITLKLAIAPDGSVTSCSVTSSQLNNPELENKIVALVRGFSFGSGGFEPWTGSHIINLFPQ